jgi:hypothetical protein
VFNVLELLVLEKDWQCVLAHRVVHAPARRREQHVALADGARKAARVETLGVERKPEYAGGHSVCQDGELLAPKQLMRLASTVAALH